MNKWTVEKDGDGWVIRDGAGMVRGHFGSAANMGGMLALYIQESDRLRTIVELLEEFLRFYTIKLSQVSPHMLSVWLLGPHGGLDIFTGETLADALAKAVAAKREAEKVPDESP